jgi:hypothetical protein
MVSCLTSVHEHQLRRLLILLLLRRLLHANETQVPHLFTYKPPRKN